MWEPRENIAGENVGWGREGDFRQSKGNVCKSLGMGEHGMLLNFCLM